MPIRSTENPVTQYAEWALGGGKPLCRWERLALERHIRDMETGHTRGVIFKPESAQYAIDWFSFCRHTKGAVGGRTIQPLPWQQFVVGSVFGWKMVDDNTRRFRYVYEEIPRKNTKSEKLSVIGLYGLIADGEWGAEIYSAATKLKQAEIIFGEAKQMARMSPEITRFLSGGIWKRNMSVLETNSKFEPLSADAEKLDGLNPHFVLIDELHAHKTRAVLDVLQSAVGARRQPLIWIITTAGDTNPDSVYAAEHADAEAILEGAADDDAVFVYMTGIDKGDRWDDPVAWEKANPMYHAAKMYRGLKAECDKAKRSPPAQGEFKRKRLNLRQGAASRAIDMDVWNENEGEPFDPDHLHGRECFGGVDLSSKIDITAFVLVFPPVEDGERWKIVPRFWIPADTMDEKSDRDKVQYQRWVSEHIIETTPGNAVDQNAVKDAVLEAKQKFKLSSLAFDSWSAQQFGIELNDQGVPALEFIQGLRSFSFPTKELGVMLAQRKFQHGGNAVLKWMANNLAVTKPDAAGNYKPTKSHSTGRIDGMVALIMALARALDSREVEEGLYAALARERVQREADQAATGEVLTRSAEFDPSILQDPSHPEHARMLERFLKWQADQDRREEF